jgi:hypothetical protein
MKGDLQPSKSNGARFQKKRDCPEMTVLDVILLPLERLSLDTSYISYPTNRFYPPSLLVGDKRCCIKANKWLDIKFGVDTRVWEKHSGDSASASPPQQQQCSPSSGPETARLHISLDSETAAALEALDRRAEELLGPILDKKPTWQPLVKRSEKGHGPYAVAKIYFTSLQGANPVPATQIKLRLPDSSLHSGAGWGGFLEKHTPSCDGFREGKCKIAAGIQFWSMNGSAGITLQTFALALVPSSSCASQKNGNVDDIFPDSDFASEAL